MDSTDPSGLQTTRPIGAPTTQKLLSDVPGFNSVYPGQIPWYLVSNFERALLGLTVSRVTVHWQAQCDQERQAAGKAGWYIGINELQVQHAILLSIDNIGYASEHGYLKPKFLDKFSGQYAVAAGTYGHEQEHITRINQGLEDYLRNYRANPGNYYRTKEKAEEFFKKGGKESMRSALMGVLMAGAAHDSKLPSGSEIEPIGVKFPGRPSADALPGWVAEILDALRDRETGVVSDTWNKIDNRKNIANAMVKFNPEG
jgi:hypothetical protein